MKTVITLLILVTWSPLVALGNSAHDTHAEYMRVAASVNTAGAGLAELIDKYDTVGAAVGYRNSEAFIEFLRMPGVKRHQSPLAGKKMGAILFLALLGGLALNCTPCVLPMIPVTLMVIGAGATGVSRKRGFFIGSLYGAGMAAAYGGIGALAALTGTTFGAINASPVFNLIIAGVFVVLALAMFDRLHIDFTRFGKPHTPDQKKGLHPLMVFGMGVVAAVLAGACVAPVVISVLVYATDLVAKGDKVGILLPFLLGVGMAIPWPFAGAGLSFLPKPGKWMIWVRNGFGVAILMVAVYYGYNGYSGLTDGNGKPAGAVTKGLDAGGAPWRHSLGEGLRAGIDQGKPVIIDFWASWCKSCNVMNATTLKDPRVVDELSHFIPIKFEARNPRHPMTLAILKRFNVLGLPTFIILNPKTHP